MTPVELNAQRQSTRAFIAADPLTLPLYRIAKAATPSGGFRKIVPAEPDVGEQVFRLLPTSDRTPEVRTSFGRLVVPTYTLLAQFDANLRRWDQFEYEGVRYECAVVRSVPMVNPYEVKADVVVWSNDG